MLPPSSQVPFFKRVQDRIEEWEKIGASPLIIRWLREGYKIPFQKPVLPFRFQPWMPRTEEETTALREMKTKLLQQGVLQPATCNKFVSRCRLEPKKDGGFRLVVDLRHLNKHVVPTTCKYESLANLEHSLHRDDWLVSFDLKSGYYHVPMHPAHTKFVTVEMDGELFAFQALPFGLSTAPRVFTKVMRPFVAALRSHGIRVLPYIDDFLLMSGSHGEALTARRVAENLIQRLGLTRNTEKGAWEPARNILHLGLQIDTERGLFCVPPAKLTTLKGAATSLLRYAKSHQRWVSVGRLAKFVGLAISLRLALQQVRTYTRSLYDAMATKQSWSADVKLSRQALADLQWFADLEEHWNGLAIWKPPPTMTLHTDASDHGWGAALNEIVPARGFFNAAQLQQHITEKELRAVWFSLQYFNKHMDNGVSLRLVTDNQVVQSVVNKGVSKSHQLMPLVREIQAFQKRRGLTLQAVYIPSAENVIADKLSRAKDKSDWQVSDAFFHAVIERWGRRTVDRFATASNAKCQRYNTWRAEPESLGNAMLQPWGGEHNWINPPWPLIPQVLRKLKEDRAEAVVLLPYWPSASWFPDLLAQANDQWILSPEEVRNMVEATNPAVPEPLRNPRWRLVAAHIPARN